MIKLKTYTKIFLLASAVLILGCEPTNQESKEEVEVVSLDLSLRDTTTLPSQNFYRYANGTWLDKTEIPADRSAWGSFHELFENNEKVLSFVLEQATKGELYDENSNEIKAANFYASAMDSLAIEQQGTEPLMPMLARIDELVSKDDMEGTLSALQMIGVTPLFNIYVGIDDKQTDRYIMNVTQSGLGLPDRDYYFREDKTGQDIIAGYKAFITKIFVLVGEDSLAAASKAENIYALEAELAANSMTRLERRNPETNYNKITLAELQENSSWLDWNRFFKGIGVNGISEINVNQLDYITKLTDVIGSANLADIKDYLKLRLISSNTGYLSNDFVMTAFNFYSKQLSGQQEMRPRSKRMVNATNGNLGDALSKLYVDEVFPPEAKAKCLEMVNNIKAAMHKRIDGLTWMSDETKKEAHMKLKKLKVKIGYPDEWKDYGSVEITKDNFLQNRWNANAFANSENFGKLGKPIDPNEWHMAASVVNAYYNPPANEIVFPAGILQPPFYNYKADEAVNYGGIGAVIGHEITHGFDDSGRKYNHEGQLKDWWTEEDGAEFERRAEVMVAQYNSFTVQDTLHVNGKLTLGENIADLGGMLIAYDALQMFYDKNGRPDNIDGMTPEQRFFMSQATLWRGKYRPELEQRLLIGDTHSPGKFRVNGPVSSMTAFYDAFGIKEGDALWRSEDERVDIW
ncbi:M13 family metallopeptidase [Reichenbachiella carrageenanivorans]|uniref:M13 family metallopeptidase n=1 Tax=Reichenbachiella carrageenanivorans TaxID=2979869 RepID=A0ABY6CVL0_9BACT|nr:M13 family metallopeptidase [Reichenbachiella carrageenanivorans]UXX77946.1 M13 family metallopeptidase [Reichenbachiella carrageenanivorans]